MDRRLDIPSYTDEWKHLNTVVLGVSMVDLGIRLCPLGLQMCEIDPLDPSEIEQDQM